MPPIPAVLLWIQEVDYDQRRGANILYGHDFREDFGWLFVEIPPDLFAFRSGERIPVRGIHVANVHRFSNGWAWETRTPERLPKPPYLLTDDPECRLVYHGAVSIRPTTWGREEVEAQFGHGDFSPIPLLGGNWFGVIQIDSDNHSIGKLVAFSRETVELPTGEGTVNWAGEDEAFGQLIIP